MINVQTEIKDSLLALSDVLSEWSKEVSVDKGVFYDPLTYQEVKGGNAFLLRQAVCDLSIPNDADNGNANRYPGVCQVSARTIECTNRLNAAKNYFESQVFLGHQQGLSRADLRVLYKEAGYPRLHPKQAWRQIVVLDRDGLKSIGFSVAKETTSGQIVSLQNVLNELASHHCFDLAQQVACLGATEFRRSTPIAPHVRANVVWGAKDKRLMRMHYASLPFLVGEGWPEKRVRFNIPRNHSRRSDFDAGQSIALPYREGAYITAIDSTLKVSA